jgi:phage terminase large subunit-like protein
MALAHVAPEHLDNLDERELLAALFDLELWLRPEQRIPRGRFRSHGTIGGRGLGKTLAYAVEINRRVEADEAHAVALMAPNLDRVREVQVAALVSSSPPWFECEAYRDGVRWPNGVQALSFTPEAPGRSRSGNFDLAWMCEIVDWQSSERLEAYRNLATATRVGAAQIFWDTTSKGKNEVIQYLLSEHARDPATNLLVRGTTFDNPLLSRLYLSAVAAQYAVGSRRYQEEVLGQVFAEAAGALWQQSWIDDHRVDLPPSDPELTIVGLDPALSTYTEADETGIVVASRARDGGVYVHDDLSGRYPPEQWGDLVVAECVAGASGVIVERNHAGDLPTTVLRARAATRGLRVELLDPDPARRPFPRRTPGRLYVREVVAARSKESRASAPATLYEQGRVHHVGTLNKLELELTTWEPGSRRSPNRLDALAYAVGELGEVTASPKRRPDVAGAVAANAALRGGLTVGLPVAFIRGPGRLGI